MAALLAVVAVFVALCASFTFPAAAEAATIGAEECVGLGFHSASLDCAKCDLLVGLPDEVVEQCRGCCDSEAGSGAAALIERAVLEVCR